MRPLWNITICSVRRCAMGGVFIDMLARVASKHSRQNVTTTGRTYHAQTDFIDDRIAVGYWLRGTLRPDRLRWTLVWHLFQSSNRGIRNAGYDGTAGWPSCRSSRLADWKHSLPVRRGKR